MVISNLILVIGAWDTSCEIALRWMSLDLTDDKSTLVQVMTWCHLTTSYYLRRCWPRSMSTNDVTRVTWVIPILITEKRTTQRKLVRRSSRFEKMPQRQTSSKKRWDALRKRSHLTGIGLPIIYLRQSNDHLRSIMGIPILQSSAVITRSNLSRYYIRHCDNGGRKWIRFWNHKSHPIPRPNGRAMGHLLW